MKSLYEILGIERSASQTEIRAAYRNLANKHHPDKGGSVERFQEIEEAYRVLKNPEQRKQYDETGSVTSANMLDQQAFAMVSEIAIGLMKQHNFVTTDYVSLTLRQVNNNTHSMNASLNQMVTTKKKVQRLIDQLEGDAMLSPLEQEKQNIEAQEKQIANQRLINTRALEILRHCKYNGMKELPSAEMFGAPIFNVRTY